MGASEPQLRLVRRRGYHGNGLAIALDANRAVHMLCIDTKRTELTFSVTDVEYLHSAPKLSNWTTSCSIGTSMSIP